MMASSTPALRSILMPWPSRDMERLDLLAAVGQIQRAVGEHAVDVEDHEAHALGLA